MTGWFRRGTIVAALIGLTALGGARPAAADNDIVIGFSVALSGIMQAYDGDSTRMAKLFIDQINAKGGLLGRKLRAFDADTKSDRAEGAKAGLAAVQAGAVMTFVTCDYDYGAPAALQAQRAGIMSVFLCAEDPKAGILGVGNLSFTASSAAQLQGAVMGEWAAEKKGWKTGYVLLDDSIEYDKSVCAGFDWMYPKKGGAIVGRDTFKNGDSSIASQVTRLANAIREKKVDVVMLCTYEPGAASAVRQIPRGGHRCAATQRQLGGRQLLAERGAEPDELLHRRTGGGSRRSAAGSAGAGTGVQGKIRLAARLTVCIPGLCVPATLGQGGAGDRYHRSEDRDGKARNLH